MALIRQAPRPAGQPGSRRRSGTTRPATTRKASAGLFGEDRVDPAEEVAVTPGEAVAGTIPEPTSFDTTITWPGRSAAAEWPLSWPSSMTSCIGAARCRAGSPPRA